MTIHIHVRSFSILVAKVYTLTSDYDVEQIEGFYIKLQSVIDKVD